MAADTDKKTFLNRHVKKPPQAEEGNLWCNDLPQSTKVANLVGRHASKESSRRSSMN